SNPRSRRPAFSAGSVVAGPLSKRAGPSSVSTTYTPIACAKPRNRRSTSSSTGARRHADQRRLEIRDHVVHVLDPDREPDQVTRGGERRVGGRGVRHAGRVLDQALDAAERLGQLEEPRPGGERERLLLVLDLERDHPTEVAHLPACQLVPGMAL